jgi:hypothetical protein
MFSVHLKEKLKKQLSAKLLSENISGQMSVVGACQSLAWHSLSGILSFKGQII